MKVLKLRKNELIAYAGSFVSFVLDRLKYNIKEIILFGSVARGDFSKDSDVDLFFDILDEKKTKLIERELRIIEKKFYNSKIFELWKQKGIKNEIKVKVGVLNKWKLKRSVISDGIVLYGKYKSEIKEKGFVMITFEPIKNVTKRNKVIRILFGRKELGYSKRGLIRKLEGKQIAPTVFYASLQFADQVLEILKKEKVNYKIFEFWSDTFN